ncbi:hypothetical protein QBC35DRAFT_490822 [Podospora australis]|uniref:Uncharacterized protein n=1 Tax=Podospora australis TaxID=1536484 RepID=A0AAN6WZI9_9PEZI|nr:hypothetical protein QBC35DRAFT_490822 [Podospora australis]
MARCRWAGVLLGPCLRATSGAIHQSISKPLGRCRDTLAPISPVHTQHSPGWPPDRPSNQTALPSRRDLSFC